MLKGSNAYYNIFKGNNIMKYISNESLLNNELLKENKLAERK